MYNEKDYEIPVLAAQALEEIGDFKIVERIRQLIREKSYTDFKKFYMNSNSVRIWMVEVVGAIGSKLGKDSFAEKLACVWTVESVLETEDMRLQKAAAEALGEIGDDSAVDSLINALGSGWNIPGDYIEKIMQADSRIDKMMADFRLAAYKVQSCELITAVVNALVKIGHCKAYPNLKSVYDGFQAYKSLYGEKSPWQGRYKDSVEKAEKQLEAALENALHELH
ncbi:MAG: HEAT repeat domain-containing protein [Spirochaetales bacterium]|nr:HEAT repeat domain-containing protein [Spirochaetales bacterium]